VYQRKSGNRYRSVYGLTERNAGGLDVHQSTQLNTSMDDSDDVIAEIRKNGN
jgi:hypothetical protein